MADSEQSFWDEMRRHTMARVGLGRAGTAMPTPALLAFEFAAARARDAVQQSLDMPALVEAAWPFPTLQVASAAPDRAHFIMRPDLGRRLSAESAAMLAAGEPGDWDLLFVVADGLSAGAAQTYALPLIAACRNALPDLAIGPIVFASQARVALADEIAEALGARAVAILLGERPGLSASASLGFYFTWHPRVGTWDSQRNCISNIHAGGLSPEAAGQIAAWLIRAALRLQISGVGLKEDAGAIPSPGRASLVSHFDERTIQMNILHIDSSIAGDASVTRSLTASIVKKLVATDPAAVVVSRDVADEPLAHVNLASLPGDGSDAAIASAVVLDEFLAADIVVMGAPMYNFAIPSQLKAWLDRILIAGRTFQYGAHGPEGLVGGKRVIVAIARGGFFGPGTPTAMFEHVETYLAGVLGFIGVVPEFVVAEGVAMGPDHRSAALARAEQTIHELAV